MAPFVETGAGAVALETVLPWAPKSPCSNMGSRKGAALEAFCPRTLPLEASRAPPPPLEVAWHGTRLPGDTVLFKLLQRLLAPNLKL